MHESFLSVWIWKDKKAQTARAHSHQERASDECEGVLLLSPKKNTSRGWPLLFRSILCLFFPRCHSRLGSLSFDPARLSVWIRSVMVVVVVALSPLSMLSPPSSFLPPPSRPPHKPYHTHSITQTPPSLLDAQADVGHLHVVARLGVHADDLEDQELLPLRQRLLRHGLHHLLWFGVGSGEWVLC